MYELRKFFFDVLSLDINVTPSHKTQLPMKKNQSLSYAIDFDQNQPMYIQLVKFVSIYPFIQLEKNSVSLKNLHTVFPQYGCKPVSFKLVILPEFKDIHYNYSSDNLYTFINFVYNDNQFNIPIERIELM